MIRPLSPAFRRSREGVSAVEFALLAPLLVLLLFGCFTLFLLFRDGYRAETATFTVADVVSRQSTVSSDFLNTTYAMFLRMLPDTQKGVAFRVSSLKMTGKALHVDWSYPIAPMTALTDATIPASGLPLVADGDSIVVVETSVGYQPATDMLGFASGRYSYLAANRPRFTAAIKKSD
ncbi:pilus assembly protein [Aurantimonas sp. MSK8Z-1]|uniref:TadE/TadG family type IV pilus assembly protein n=1 Tax=Mangrovibrevibacter kandeliae TaxID=2968473 RepID=UPI0021197946|nr:TadE/TadG family type IV pilus assembly protein [Aurantimonas sp. MSK8Z-1]MCW4115306.1 pilus assembly protein [Aurantimonas sp. MSK8Z-1]